VIQRIDLAVMSSQWKYFTITAVARFDRIMYTDRNTLFITITDLP